MISSSGKKRGLAVAAVSAMTIVGLPLAASAQTVAQGEPAFQLSSQYSGGASTRNDGVNTTVTLFAGTPAAIGATTVNAVKFSYMKGATAVEIQTVVPIDGVATMQWTPPTGAEGAAITGVKAEALSNANVPLATQTQTVVGATFGTAQATNLAGALRSEVGVGPDGEIVVKGTTTDTAANTQVSVQGPTAAGPVGTTTTKTPDANNVSQFTAIVPVPAADLPVDAPSDKADEVIVGSQVTGSDDVNAYTAYLQNVTAANVAPASAEVQKGGTNDKSTYTITVTDQKGAPVQGLDIYEADAAGTKDAGANPGNGGTLDGSGNYVAGNGGETNTDGKFVAALQESDIDNAGDRDPATNSQATFYVVDVNQNGVYNSGTDYLFKVTQTAYVATPTTVELSSAKGAAIDDDESTVVTALVKDQKGNPVQGANVIFNTSSVRKDVTPNTTSTTGPTTVVTDAQGKASFTQAGVNNQWVETTINAYVNNNGTPQPDAGDAIATPFKLVSDLSVIKWDKGTKAQAGAGTTAIQSGKLVQVDTQSVLPGRNVAITLADVADADPNTPGNQPGNAALSPQAQQPAGTTRGSDTTASSTTDAAGAFAVALTDPATPAGQELGDQLTADAPALDSLGDSTAATLTVDWLRSLTPTLVTLAGNPAPQYGGAVMPGSLSTSTVSAFNADGVKLDDVVINLTIGEGNFVNPKDIYDPTPVAGANAGEWKSAGKTIAVDTGDSGNGLFLVNIERNTGFDDDGIVQDHLQATVGGVSDGQDFNWTTNATPLNPRQDAPLVVSLDATQDSSILPKARAGNPNGSGDTVDYDVSTFDQFGNPTSQALAVSDNTPLADFASTGSSEFALNQPAIQAFASKATSQTLKIALQGASTLKYKDNPYNSKFDPAAPPVFNNVPVDINKTTDPISWYALDFAKSTFVLDQEGPDSVPAGTTVTEVLTATDQEGQPITGLPIGFLRVGPSNDGDTDGNAGDITNQDGKAFYDFAGNSAGTASSTAVIYNDQGVRQGKSNTDTITFTGGTPSGPKPIHPSLTGIDKGAKDKLIVKAGQAAHGAKVSLYRVAGGKRHLVATGYLGATGRHAFKVSDKNGSLITRYIAVVEKTARTKAGTSNVSRVH